VKSLPPFYYHLSISANMFYEFYHIDTTLSDRLDLSEDDLFETKIDKPKEWTKVESGIYLKGNTYSILYRFKGKKYRESAGTTLNEARKILSLRKKQRTRLYTDNRSLLKTQRSDMGYNSPLTV